VPPRNFCSLLPKGDSPGGGNGVTFSQSWLCKGGGREETLDVIDPLGTAVSPLLTGPGAPVVLQLSDIRLKHDVVAVAKLDNGLNLYRYLWSDIVYVGVMAQEVAQAYPQSVMRGSDGYLRVDYQSLGLRLRTLGEWDALTYGTGL
jgi:hypothetical protein